LAPSLPDPRIFKLLIAKKAISPQTIRSVNVTEEVYRFIPLTGSVIPASLSIGGTYYSLKLIGLGPGIIDYP